MSFRHSQMYVPRGPFLQVELFAQALLIHRSLSVRLVGRCGVEKFPERSATCAVVTGETVHTYALDFLILHRANATVLAWIRLPASF